MNEQLNPDPRKALAAKVEPLPARQADDILAKAALTALDRLAVDVAALERRYDREPRR